jgi:DNA topoisomerase-1
MEFLEKHFSNLFQYDYTAGLETELDRVAKGEQSWHDVCSLYNAQIDALIDALDSGGCRRLQVKIDDNHTFLIGKHGPVIKCMEEIDDKETLVFKSVKKDIHLKDIESGKITNLAEIVEVEKSNPEKKQILLGQYGENKDDVILRKGKFGLYVKWGKNTKALKEFGNRPMENITLEEVRGVLEEGTNIIRSFGIGNGTDLSIRRGPKGDYIFYKTSRMKKPCFYDVKAFYNETQEDYKTCDIDVLKSWIASRKTK